jgi:hypothetical protein
MPLHLFSFLFPLPVLHHDPLLLSCFLLFLHFLPVLFWSVLACTILFAGSKMDKELDELQEKAVSDICSLLVTEFFN